MGEDIKAEIEEKEFEEMKEEEKGKKSLGALG